MCRLVSSEPLLLWEQALEAQAFHFVSYRLQDGTRSAFDKVQALVAEGVPVFWDRWSLPRRLAERREVLHDTVLNQYIAGEITRAAVVWGIDSPLYDEEGSYSAQDRGITREEKPQKSQRPFLLPLWKYWENPLSSLSPSEVSEISAVFLSNE